MNKEIIKKIFDAKTDFHIENAKDPVAIKVQKLIRLQRITLSIKPELNKNSSYVKKVWEL